MIDICNMASDDDADIVMSIEWIYWIFRTQKYARPHMVRKHAIDENKILNKTYKTNICCYQLCIH